MKKILDTNDMRSTNEKDRNNDMEEAASIISAVGNDSQHHLALNSESSYFFGADVYGVIPYMLVGKRAMSQGDPVCKSEDVGKLIDEYLTFCKNRGYKPIFNSVGSEAADVLRSGDVRVLRYGKEAIIDLNSYTLAGRKKGALRRNAAKLDRAGVTLTEYCPQVSRDYSLEEEIFTLEVQWLADKKLKLRYSVGGLQFEEPYGRRYFITKDTDGELLTALSFLPYRERKGYCVDVMYRKPDGPTGAMEHAIISAAMKMKEDGVEEVSLNIAPLAGIDITKPGTVRAEKLMYEIFSNMDFGYDFKNLYRFKSKFDPTAWKQRYLVYDSSISLVRLATSITDTKGADAPALYMRYKRFFISLLLFPNRYRKSEN